MPNYTYIAKSFDGQSETGKITARDERQLAQDLKSRGMILIRADVEEKKKKFSWNMTLSFPGIPLSEKIMMTKNLGVMFSTGLSLTKSFDILVTQAKNKKLKAALTDIRDRVNKGEALSDALTHYPAIFSELFCNMIKVGEESGTLDKVFDVLTLQLQKEYELKSKIKNAMIYPSIIILVMIVVGIVMVTVVLPSLNVFFTALNVNIPIYTRILLAVGQFLSEQWYLLIVGPLGLGLAFYLTIKTKKGKEALDTILLRIPLVAPIIKKSNSAFLIRSLSSLMASGVALIRALEISAKTVGNHYFKEALIEAGAKIKKGEKLSGALKSHRNIFPVGVIEMIEVGEETGKTSDILEKLANFYEQEAIAGVEKLTTLIEPLLIIFLGLAVGAFAFSIIQPMYSSLKFINQ